MCALVLNQRMEVKALPYNLKIAVSKPFRMKALALLSGGLDSILAAKLVQDQGIKVYGTVFVSPFFRYNKEECEYISKKFKIPIKIIYLNKNYLKIIKKPKYGYGKYLNPCIDCKIFMLKQAKKYAKEIGAKFIVTGEVLNQRPKSQYKQALLIIERESKLKGKLLRPLSAKLLPLTEVEKKGIVNREKLLAIEGRSRKTQLGLAKKYNIKKYKTPAGGCLLTEQYFSKKLKDLLQNKRNINLKDLELLKLGRHFRFNKNKIIVGRNEQENKLLLKIKNPGDAILEVLEIPSPITFLQGPKTKKAIKIAASLTIRYSDAKAEKVKVNYNKKIIEIIPLRNLEKLRI